MTEPLEAWRFEFNEGVCLPARQPSADSSGLELIPGQRFFNQ